MSGTTGEGVAPSSRDEVATGRGWVQRPGRPVEPALFFLAGSSLGVTDIDGGRQPDWYDLLMTTNLDAIGDPEGDVQPIEMSMADGRILTAGWPEEFCATVVDSLRATLGGSTEVPAPPSSAAAPVPPAAPVVSLPPVEAGAPAAAPVAPLAPVEPPLFPTPAVPVEPAQSLAPAELSQPATAPPGIPGLPEPADPSVEPDRTEPVAPAVAPAQAVEAAQAAAGSTAPALVLEDVTYLGGYPGQNKKRKKCTATLTQEAVEFAGPNGIGFRVPWDVVRTIEAQNADEARFRINTKVHRDATALVLECDQDVTILLEARDCPTIPLRNAIAQLVSELPVVVV